jgi:tRNA U34 5-methylaminomethyl-2-thiouridine-forming methyltransferase MnmC
MRIRRDIIVTDDGSHTVYDRELNESYHSRFGALQESRHIFISAGLEAFSTAGDNILILEVGLGTGLNALLSLQHALRSQTGIRYFAVEPRPLEETVYSKLNYPLLPELADAGRYFIQLHRASFGRNVRITPFFDLRKSRMKIEEVRLPARAFHLVFFDAFSPDVQPELWTEAVFRRISDSMTDNGILLTYSCKGTVKKALVSAGFKLQKLPGPPGKREFIRAVLQRG